MTSLYSTKQILHEYFPKVKWEWALQGSSEGQVLAYASRCAALHLNTLSQCYLFLPFAFPDSLLLPDFSGKTSLPFSVCVCVCWCISHDGTRNLPLYTTIGRQEAHSAPSCLWSSVTSWQVSDSSQNHLITLFAKNTSQQTKIIGQWPHELVFLAHFIIKRGKKWWFTW